MKGYIAMFALLICSYTNGQDTALFKRVDSHVARIESMASKGMFDTLKTNRTAWNGTIADIFILKQGRVVQKIYIVNDANNSREFTIFQAGKPVFRQVFTSSVPWKYYYAGENAYLYIKEDNVFVTLNRKFSDNEIKGFLNTFKDQVNIHNN